MEAEKKIKKRLKSFDYAAQGVLILFKTQGNALIHLVASILVIALGFIFHIEKVEWIIVVFCIVIVLAAEAFNSALEFLADHVTKERHPAIKKVKDLAAGAVLITAIGAAIIGILIFYPYIFEWVQTH